MKLLQFLALFIVLSLSLVSAQQVIPNAFGTGEICDNGIDDDADDAIDIVGGCIELGASEITHFCGCYDSGSTTFVQYRDSISGVPCDTGTEYGCLEIATNTFNGVDCSDYDGIYYPGDANCQQIIVAGLRPEYCNNLVDDDNDGEIDEAECITLQVAPGIKVYTCSTNADCSEGQVCEDESCVAFCPEGTATCSDGTDNDGDSFTDYPNDPECRSPLDNDETSDPVCADGTDNDGDGSIDYPEDSDCVAPHSGSEGTVAIAFAPEEEQGFFAKLWTWFKSFLGFS